MLKSILTILLMGLVMGLGATAAYADHHQYEMQVDGLTCPFCVATSSKALKKIDGVYGVSVDLDTGIISVCAASGADLSDARMTRLFRKKGFTYRSQTVTNGCTIKNMVHSETGKNVLIHNAKEETPKESDHSHKDHHRYGS